MEEMNIYTLLTIIRGFSNAITVRALSDRLGVSYSTFARCKNGVWPRSITRDSMKNVIDWCKDCFFEEDGEALAHSVLLQLNGTEIDTFGLEDALTQGGYDGFVSDLLAYAEDPQSYLESLRKRQTLLKKESYLPRELLFAIPLALILLIGVFNVSFSSIFEWAASNHLAFLSISLFIALSPTICGLALDVPYAWHIYVRNNPDASLSLHSLSQVAKNGDIESVKPGAGRFNFDFDFFLYQPVCNVLGMLCYVSLLAFLLTLPTFSSFFYEHEWTEFFKVGIVVAYFISYAHMREQSGQANDVAQDANAAENPDDYLPTRTHVCANAIHLVWTISLLIVLSLSLVAYSIVNYRMFKMPLLMLWPYLQSMIFFFFTCTSRRAIRIRAKSVGILLPGVVATSVGSLLLCTICYLPSWGTIAICVACTLSTTCALVWVRIHSTGDLATWIAEGQRTGVYSVAIASTIFVLLMIGLVTTAFL